MKKVIVGHRGVGKTNLLSRHAIYFPDVIHFDLDLEIEKSVGQSIQDIFTTQGEKYFRDLEQKTFKTLTQAHTKYVISLGAGYDLNSLNPDDEVLFVSRTTDPMGRIFIDRPRLNIEMEPLDEYQQHYQKRQISFQEKADHVYHMPEGLEGENLAEKKILTKTYKIPDAVYTLSEKEILQVNAFKKNYGCIELRSDLITMENIKKIIETDSQFNWLVSIRTVDIPPVGPRLDIDLHTKDIPIHFLSNKKNIISCHDDNIDKAIQLVEKYDKFHTKISPIVENFEDLLKGHSWQQASPEKRNFLPRSKNGKWIWFRQLSKYWQKLNFIRNRTELLDQPSIYQWLCFPAERPNHFAAVLGNPVLFSRSPEIHKSFFDNKNSFFSMIELTEAEFLKHHLWLIACGLTYVAVTSPLKKIAAQLSTKSSENVKLFQSANTLVCKQAEIFSENTDVLGFQKLIEVAQIHDKHSIAVWGGGGTLQMMKTVLPQAYFFSSRSDMIESQNLAPDIVIWAAPRTAQTNYPPSQWQPKLVIDLNYLENSMGLQYAQKIQSSYISGLSMFKSQALNQQKYWSTL